MSTSTSLETRARSTGETEIFRHSARTIHDVVRLNVDGLTQADSLIRPRPAGNCLNWVVGHLLCVYQNLLPMLKQRPVIKASALRRYDRGSPPIENADEAMELSELMAAWDGTAERIDAGLADLSAETLDAPAPFSPRGDPG